MAFRVMERSGRSLAEVLDSPASLILWTFLQLMDAERITGVMDKLARVESARLMALAFYEPAKLDEERTAILRQAVPLSRDARMAWIEDARAMMRDLERSEAVPELQWQPWLGGTNGEIPIA